MLGIILFPNAKELVDLAVIDAFLAYHHSKESSVIAVLADAYVNPTSAKSNIYLWIDCCTLVISFFVTFRFCILMVLYLL